MKYNLPVLIDRIKTEIARREKEATDRTSEAATEYAASMTAYVARTHDAWTTFANTIRRKVRAGHPVRNGDVPDILGGRRGSFNGYLDTFGDRVPTPYVADVQTLRTLLDLLESSTSAETSTSELEGMGFRMRDLFQSRD